MLDYSTALFVLVLRYSYIMITGHSDGQNLVMRANEKYLVKTQEQPERGKIYDRNGKILAEDVQRYKLVAIIDKNAGEVGDTPRYVKDKRKQQNNYQKLLI